MLGACGICNENLDQNNQCRCTRQGRASSDRNSGRRGCIKCGGTRTTVTQMSATGGGLSRMLNVQYQVYDVISCVNCGYSEMYKRDSSSTMNIVDLFFG